MQLLPVGIALLLEYLAVLLVALVAFFFFREKVKARLWAAIGLVLVGLAVVAQVWASTLDALVADPPAAPAPGADVAMANHEAVTMVRRLIAEELTERQSTALTAILNGVPMDDVARHLDTNRNALYKLLHDARLRLRKAFEARGLPPDDLLDDAT